MTKQALNQHEKIILMLIIFMLVPMNSHRKCLALNINRLLQPSPNYDSFKTKAKLKVKEK